MQAWTLDMNGVAAALLALPAEARAAVVCEVVAGDLAIQDAVRRQLED